MVKTLPFADVVVNTPGFGAMGFSHHRGPATEDESLKTLAKAVELGCTFWDTATVYGYGHNEALLGRFLRESGTPRDSVFIGSKCGHLIDFENKKSLGGDTNSAEHIREYLQGTTERLGSPPDLYYLHRIDPNTPLEESISTLAALKKEGKCKYIGVCETSAETLRKACSVAPIDTLQVEYSPWCTDHERNGVLDAAKELGVTVIAYSPLGRGVLTGAFTDASAFAGENDNRGGLPKYSAKNLPGNLKLVQELAKIAESKNCTVGQLSIAWVLAQGAIAIPGTRNASRLEENWRAREVSLTDEELKVIRSVIDSNVPKGDRYDAEQMKKIGH